MKMSRYSLCITLIFTISVVMIISGSTDVLGIDAGLSISANAVEGSDTIEITGQTSNAYNDITFTVKAPNGNLVSIDQISPRSNGYFATVISVGGPLWSQDGMYTVVAQQGNKYMYIDSVNIRIADGVLGKQFGYGITSDQNKQYQNDCTATNIKWDKKIERNEDFTITWHNPDTSNCRYDVSYYRADKSGAGVFTNKIDLDSSSWNSIGIKYFKICPTNDNDCKSNSEFHSFQLINTSIDCTLKNSPKWDKTVERGESFTITWNNPDTNNCRYDVSFYHNDKTDGGVHYDIVRDWKGDWDSSGTKFFKICPTNDNDCKSPFYSFTLEDTSGNIVFIIVGIVVTIGISIAFVSKKNIRKKSPVSSSTPVSTEKSQKGSITEIDKQIAINEEKIRKMEEESKKLDEEN